MKKTIVRIAAALSAAVMCAVPAVSNFSANAAVSQFIDIKDLILPPRITPFNPFIAADYLFGDVNHDHVVDGRDASCVLSYPNVSLDMKLSDINNNRRIDRTDADLILSYYTKTSANVDLTGDANNDGSVDMADSILLQQHTQNPDVYRIKNMIYADVNRDTLVNVVDANLVQRYNLGCFSSFMINFGDVNDDGVLSDTDYNYISSYYGQTWNKKTISAAKFIRCDANGDGTIDSLDYATIYNAVHGYGYKY